MAYSNRDGTYREKSVLDGSKKVLVSGAAGFIGRAICKRLSAEGWQVVGLDNYSRHGPGVKAEGVHSFKEGDVRNALIWRRLLEYHKPSVVVHAAAVNGTQNFYEKPWEVLEVGVEGTLNAVRESAKAGVEKFFYLSSSEVYGEPLDVPTPEDVPRIVADVRNPRYSYGGGKIAGELMVLHGPLGFASIIVPNNVYGPRMGQSHVVPQLFEKVRVAQQGGVVEVQGGEQTRTFCYVEDFVDGFMAVFSRGADRGIYNVGGSEPCTINELVALMMKEEGKLLEVKSVGVPEGDPQKRQPSLEKVRALGYEPKVGLVEGLRLFREGL